MRIIVMQVESGPLEAGVIIGAKEIFGWLDEVVFICVAVRNLTEQMIADIKEGKLKIDFEHPEFKRVIPDADREKYLKNKVEIFDQIRTRVAVSGTRIFNDIKNEELKRLHEIMNSKIVSYPDAFPELGLSHDTEFRDRIQHLISGEVHRNVSHHVTRVEEAVAKKQFEETGFKPNYIKSLDLSVPGLLQAVAKPLNFEEEPL